MQIFQPSCLDPIVTVYSAVAGRRYHVPDVGILDQHLRQLSGFLRTRLVPKLRAEYYADVDLLLLRRLWLTLPVDPNAREWVDQCPIIGRR